MDIAEDPRFQTGLALIESQEFLDASELFEELFLEAVRDEVEFARVFLQLAVGFEHLDRGQRTAGADRLEEAIKAIDRVMNDRGFDLGAIRDTVEEMIESARGGERFVWQAMFR